MWLWERVKAVGRHEEVSGTATCAIVNSVNNNTDVLIDLAASPRMTCYLVKP